MTLPENNSSNIAVFGNFDRNIKVMSINSDEVIAELNVINLYFYLSICKAHMGGLTCLKFSPVDQNYLVSGGRKDNLVYLWVISSNKIFSHKISRI